MTLELATFDEATKTHHMVLVRDSFAPQTIPVFNLSQPTLAICDAPYGITKEKWDVARYGDWMALCAKNVTPDATVCMWGGTGTPKKRPFILFAATVERDFPEWTILNWITWGKRRAYGTAGNYLYTREECLILTRGEPVFNIPLLEQKRGYAGYNEKYPAKSEFLRRSNVWTDINELFKGKTHPNEKPRRLYEVLIETHSKPGDTVFDPCAGSGVTQRAARATGRHSVIIEQDREYLEGSGILPTEGLRAWRLAELLAKQHSPKRPHRVAGAKT